MFSFSFLPGLTIERDSHLQMTSEGRLQEKALPLVRRSSGSPSPYESISTTNIRHDKSGVALPGKKETRQVRNGLAFL